MVAAPSGPDPQNEAADARLTPVLETAPLAACTAKFERNASASSGTKEDSHAGPMSQAMGQTPIWTGPPIWAEGPKAEAHFGPITATARRRMNERGLLQRLQSLREVRACSLSFSWRACLPVYRLPRLNLSRGLRHHVDASPACLRRLGCGRLDFPQRRRIHVVRLEASIRLGATHREHDFARAGLRQGGAKAKAELLPQH